MAACKGSRYCRGRQTGASGKSEHCRTPVAAIRLEIFFPKQVQTPLINQCVDCRSTVLPVSRLASECCATFSARQPSCQQLLVSATCTHRRRSRQHYSQVCSLSLPVHSECCHLACCVFDLLNCKQATELDRKSLTLSRKSSKQPGYQSLGTCSMLARTSTSVPTAWSAVKIWTLCW